MVGTTRIALFDLLAFLLIVSAQASDTSSWFFRNAEKDGKGMVWAIADIDQNRLAQLARFDGIKWEIVSAPLPTGSSGVAIVSNRMQDGSVAFFWRLSNGKLAITKHLGDRSTLLAEGDAEPNGIPNFCRIADARNQIWFTAKEGKIYRTTSDQKFALAYQLKPEDLLKIEKNDPQWKDNFLTEDGRKRIWVCSRNLHSILILDGGKIEWRDLKGNKQSRIRALAKKDAKHMWAAVYNDGLYEVDIDTFEAKPVIDLPHELQKNIADIFTRGDDLYLVINQPASGSLWRLRDGEFKQIIQGVRKNPNPEFTRTMTKTGFILPQAPAWFVGDSGEATPLDWRHEFPEEDAVKILHLKDGSLLAIGFNGGLFRAKISLPPKSITEKRIGEIKLSAYNSNGILFDSSGNGWCFLANREGLMQWDGSKWIEHPLPDGLKSRDILCTFGYFVDSRDRIWIRNSFIPPPAIFYDSKSDRWRQFPTLEQAFTTLRNEPPEFSCVRDALYIPIYSQDCKRVAFRKDNRVLAYFDGENWKTWNQNEIALGKNNITPPFFNTKDRLCVNMGKETWELDDQNHWTKITFENRFPEDLLPKGPKVNTCYDCDVASPDSVVQDNLGSHWLTKNGVLYKCMDGHSVKIPSKWEPGPFVAGSKIEKVFVAPNRNIFLGTTSHRWFMIKPKNPPVETSIAISFSAEDSILAKFRNDVSSETRFCWKIDTLPWQEASENEISLDFLANGRHILSAFALDDEMQPAGTIATEEFEVKIEPQKQIASFIKHLSDKEFSKREAAVLALARQPHLALPALQKARESANADMQWWIDATLQEIESRKNSPATVHP